MAVLLSPNAKQQFLTSSGALAAGYKLYTYASGTGATIPRATYTDRAGSVANTNPIVLDARGEAVVYLTPGVVYDYVLKSGDDVTEWTREGVMADAGDADAVSFLQSGSGAVERTVQSKLLDVEVNAADFGLVGDGTDEVAKIQQFFDRAAGRVARLEGGKTYGFDPNVLLTIKEGTTLRTNGSRFVATTTHSDYMINVEGGTDIDHLEVEIPGNASARGVRVLGSNVRIGRIIVRSLSAQCGAGNFRRRAVRIGTENAPRISNVDIGLIDITDWDYGMSIHGVDNLRIGWLNHTRFLGSVWIEDLRHSKIEGGHINENSASVQGAPGENGILMESSAYHGHHGSTNVHFYNVLVNGSGEHGFRIGGQYVVSNVTYHACKAKNTGSGTAQNHGGCGFKCLGPTNLDRAGAYHQDIRYVDCVVEDVDTTGAGTNNFAGFNIGKTWGFSIVNPIIRCSIKDQDSDPTTPPVVSCGNGIEIIGSRYGTITNPIIYSPLQNGVFLYDIVDAGNSWGVRNEWITIDGGEINNPGANGIQITPQSMDFRRIKINDVLVDGGVRHTYIAILGGSLTICSISGQYVNGGSTVETLGGATNCQVDMSGAFVGANACLNGSTFRDHTANAFKIRKGGAWVTL